MILRVIDSLLTSNYLFPMTVRNLYAEMCATI